MGTPIILFEDSDLMVLDKPAGWIVNNASSAVGQHIIQTWIAENFNFEVAKNIELRSGVVHRLDKETSGCLVIAKKAESFAAIQAMFKKRDVKKTYTALAHGLFKQKKGEVNASVGRLPWRRDRFGVLSGGREALTKYFVKGEFKDEKDKYSLVELNPQTGRTHQIRIHLKHLGHPIVSDNFYAGRKTSRKDRLWCPRLFLHASQISFPHPQGKKPINISSPLPNDLSLALSSLEELHNPHLN